MKTRTILLWHNNGAERIFFAVNPAEIHVSRPNQNKVYPLAMGGNVNAWGGRGLREVRLHTFLPTEGSPFYEGIDPQTILTMLKTWQDSGDPVRLILSDSDINDAFLIEDITETLREGDRDIGLSVTLREYKFKSALEAQAGTNMTVRQDERILPKTYTVRQGDTLWGIACRFYGDGTRWSVLAAKNHIGDPRSLQTGAVLML